MTKAEMAEQELADMGVRVIRCPWLHCKAVATADGFLGVGETEDSCEARTILLHEKQHYRLRAFYAANADPLLKRRAETQVNRAVYREACPPDVLAALLRRGFTVPEIAEELEVTQALVEEAYAYYAEQMPALFGAAAEAD